jgi:hypothetical protein
VQALERLPCRSDLSAAFYADRPQLLLLIQKDIYFYFPRMTFESIENRYKEFLSHDADLSISLGMTNKLGELSDPGLEAHYRRIDEAQALKTTIENATSDDFYQSLDLKLMALDLKQRIFRDSLAFNGKLQRQQLPKGVDGISQGILQLFINDTRAPSRRIDNIVSRLWQAPDYLKKELEALDRPVERWRDVEMQRAKGLPELFAAASAWATSENYSHLDELKKAVAETNDALGAYHRTLSKMATTTRFAIGEEKALSLLELMEIDESPIQLRDMAAGYLAETNEIIEPLRIRLVKKYNLDKDASAAFVQDFLKIKYRVPLTDDNPDPILDIYEKQKNALLKFVIETNLFPLLENQEIKIIKTPAYLEPVIPAGACWTPIPLREGTKTSLVYLTLKKELIDEHTALGIPLMMAHEGIPGHHLQLAHACSQPSLVRKIFNAYEHAEGWTTMLEDYVLDRGLFEDDLVDEARFIEKREIARLAARVGIDLYFMTGNITYLEIGYDLRFVKDDPFENAAEVLKTATGFSDGRVRAELNWYSMERGYPLCYLTGNRMVWALKRDILDKNVKQLSALDLDKEFHRIYLHSGCMPIKSLREVYRFEGFL